MDQNVGCYRISIRSKKWWWPLFIYMIDVSVQNAFYLYWRSSAYSQRRLDLLDFKREIVEVYSQRYAQRLKVVQPATSIRWLQGVSRGAPWPPGSPATLRWHAEAVWCLPQEGELRLPEMHGCQLVCIQKTASSATTRSDGLISVNNLMDHSR